MLNIAILTLVGEALFPSSFNLSTQTSFEANESWAGSMTLIGLLYFQSKAVLRQWAMVLKNLIKARYAKDHLFPRIKQGTRLRLKTNTAGPNQFKGLQRSWLTDFLNSHNWQIPACAALTIAKLLVKAKLLRLKLDTLVFPQKKCQEENS